MSFTESVLCTKTHEYFVNEGKSGIIGLTDYAVEQLGDIVYVDLPSVGQEFKKGDSFAAVESVKAASDIYMPVSGKIIEVNSAVVDTPEILNENCYENGWLVKIEKTSVDEDMSDLMSYSDYKKELE